MYSGFLNSCSSQGHSIQAPHLASRLGNCAKKFGVLQTTILSVCFWHSMLILRTPQHRCLYLAVNVVAFRLLASAFRLATWAELLEFCKQHSCQHHHRRLRHLKTSVWYMDINIIALRPLTWAPKLATCAEDYGVLQVFSYVNPYLIFCTLSQLTTVANNVCEKCMMGRLRMP